MIVHRMKLFTEEHQDDCQTKSKLPLEIKNK